jgi:hypothetical protein
MLCRSACNGDKSDNSCHLLSSVVFNYESPTAIWTAPAIVIYRIIVELTFCFFSGQMSEDNNRTAFGTAIYRLHSSHALLDGVDFDFGDWREPRDSPSILFDLSLSVFWWAKARGSLDKDGKWKGGRCPSPVRGRAFFCTGMWLQDWFRGSVTKAFCSVTWSVRLRRRSALLTIFGHGLREARRQTWHKHIVIGSTPICKSSR